MRNNDVIVKFHFFGQICVPVHKGYKIFDLRRGVVVKVFDPDVHPLSISNEIEKLKNVSQIDFAPSLKRWDIDKRWYEEDYVSGSLDSSYQPMDSQSLLRKFCHDLVPHINSLVLFQQPIIKNSLEYANEMMQTIRASRLSKQETTAEEFNKINNFLDFIVKGIQAEGNCLVYLVFTHGDFCPANMLNTRQGIKIIDWESAGYRSALFDFYSYFFYRPLCRKVPISTLISEINQAMPFFVGSLANKAPEISNNLLHLEKVYRWIYYIEEIYKGVGREMTDKNLNILGDILGYIEAFNRYEEILACKVQGLESCCYR
jgi:hypothetical protein